MNNRKSARKNKCNGTHRITGRVRKFTPLSMRKSLRGSADPLYAMQVQKRPRAR